MTTSTKTYYNSTVTNYFGLTTAELLNTLTCDINKVRAGELHLFHVSPFGSYKKDGMPVFRLSLYFFDTNDVLVRHTFRDISYFNYSLIYYIGSTISTFRDALSGYPGGIVLDDESYLDDDEYAEMQKLQRYVDNIRKNKLGQCY